jgi:hypothetical protein
MGILGRTIVLAAATLASCALSATAEAQVRISISSAGAAGDSSTISAKAVDRYAGILGLDAGQREALRTLHSAYMTEVEEAGKRLREASKKAREAAEDGDMTAVLVELEKASAKQQARWKELTDTLLQDLRGMLTPDQESKWLKLERARRRESLPMLAWMPGSVSGSAVDLCLLVEGLSLPAEEAAKAAPALEEYEVELDALIREGQAELASEEEEAKKKSKDDPAQEGPARMLDPVVVQEMIKKTHARSLRARDVNRRYVERLSASLGEEWRARLISAWNKAAFRKVYREPHILKQLKVALSFADLDEDQKRALQALLAEYEAGLLEANARWAEALLRRDTEGPSMMLGMNPEDESEAGKARKARLDLDKAIRERMRSLLNESQQSRLPKMPSGPLMVMPGGEEIEIDLGDMDLPEGADVHFMAVPAR